MSREITIDLPSWMRVEEVLGYWGRDPGSVNERIDERSLTWALRLGDRPIVLEARLEEARARIELCSAETGAPLSDLESDASATTLVRRLLGLHLDPTDFESRLLSAPASQRDPLAKHVERRLGLTIPQTPTFFDGVVWVIAGQQVSLPVAFSIRRRLSLAYGLPVSGIGKQSQNGTGPLVVPPSVRDIARIDDEALFDHGLSRRKAEYLAGIARAAHRGELDLEGLRNRPGDEVEKILLRLRGFGPWSVNYLRMRSLGHADCVPVGDVALQKALQRLHGLDHRPGTEETLALMAPYAPHRSLGTFHLWASLRDEP